MVLKLVLFTVFTSTVGHVRKIKKFIYLHANVECKCGGETPGIKSMYEV